MLDRKNKYGDSVSSEDEDDKNEDYDEQREHDTDNKYRKVLQVLDNDQLEKFSNDHLN